MAQFSYLDDEDVSQPERDTRADVSIMCEARQGTRPWRKVRLEDLSPGGFRVAWMPDVRTDTPLRIRIPGMQMLSARIVWQRDNALGCAFEEPLYPAVFEHLVRAAS